PPVGPVGQPLLGPADRGQPGPQALRDCVVLAFGGQWLGGVVDVLTLLVLARPVLAARSLGVRKQPLHLGPLGPQPGSCLLLVHLAPPRLRPGSATLRGLPRTDRSPAPGSGVLTQPDASSRCHHPRS